jgi:ATP-dependent RNA helicase RhlB
MKIQGKRLILIRFIKNLFTKRNRNKTKTKPTKPQQPLTSSDPRGKSEKPISKGRRRTKGEGRPEKVGAKSRHPQKKGRPRKKWTLDNFQVSPREGMTRFHDLNLPLPIMHAIFELGYEYCTPIQSELLPATIAGQDGYGQAQTGTGKTAAFLIAAMTRMQANPIQGKRRSGTPRVLVVAPTRELVLQISAEADRLSRYTKIKTVSVFGGMDYEKQRRRLTGHVVDIVVATPGRLLDFHRRKDLNLGRTEILILDEADRMLDMGFIPDVRRIVYATPAKDKRQTMLFSATLTPDVTRLSAQWTKNPISVVIEPEQVAVDTVDQVVYIVTQKDKFALIYNIITKQDLRRVLIFCNRRDETRRLAEMLTRHSIDCDMLSGDVPQRKRIRTLDNFKSGKLRALVATDVAGRGIHIEDMSHVINYHLPRDPEDYVHRIGRTGRAGASGTSVSFADEEDSFYIPAIEEFIGRELTCTQPDEDWLSDPPPPKPSKRKPAHRRHRGGQPKKAGKPRGRRPPRRRRYSKGKGGGGRRPKASSDRSQSNQNFN